MTAQTPDRRPSLLWRLARRRLAMAGLLLVALLALLALAAPYIAPHDPVGVNPAVRLQAPSREYPLGTDALGRDVLSRILHGGRISLLVGIAPVALGSLVGVTLGLMAGYFRGIADLVIMRIMDVAVAVPSFLLALAVSAALGPSLTNMMLAVGVALIPDYARVGRAAALRIVNLDYIEAARATGATRWHVILRHLLPNSAAPLIVQVTLDVGRTILTAAGLSFLGMGAQPPTPEWGAIAAGGRDQLARAWWISTFSGLCIMMAVLGFNLVGDGVRDALDPMIQD